jgi:hypothetical protein
VDAPDSLSGDTIYTPTFRQILLYLGVYVIYNLYFHPLSAYPGPFLACCSRLWYTRALLNGTLPFAVHEAHEKYGGIVRFAPDELAYIDSRAWKDIYGPRPGKQEILRIPTSISTPQWAS